MLLLFVPPLVETNNDFMNTLLPAVIETAIKPKPTKTELLTALARLHIEKVQKENVERKAVREETSAKLERMLVAVVRKKGAVMLPSCNWYFYRGGKPTASVSFSLRNEDITPELVALIKKHSESSDLCVPCIANAKKQVREAMGEMVNTSARVDALLSDKDSRKALETALEAMS